jgi:hypothetical protein
MTTLFIDLSPDDAHFSGRAIGLTFQIVREHLLAGQRNALAIEPSKVFDISGSCRPIQRM